MHFKLRANPFTFLINLIFILLLGCNSTPKTSDEIDEFIDKNYTEIEIAKSKGDYEEAARLYTLNIKLINDFLLEQTDKIKGRKMYNRSLINHYDNRGSIKMKLKDFAGAISDFSNAISLDESAQSGVEKFAGIHMIYYHRAFAKFEFGGNGCDDLKKANEYSNNLFRHDKYSKNCDEKK